MQSDPFHGLFPHLNRRQFVLQASAFGLSLPLLASKRAEAANHKVDLSIVGFRSREKAIVESAFWIAMERCFKPKVIRLAAKNTYRSRGFPHDAENPDDVVSISKGKEAEESISAFVVWGLADMLGSNGGDDAAFNFELKITAADLVGSVGRATVGLNTVWGYHHSDSRKRRRYAIELDKTAVDRRDKQDTAGTIWHEMLHNTGLSHGKGTDYEKNYAGYLIKEWGLAVAVDGVTAFSLADRDPYARSGCG